LQACNEANYSLIFFASLDEEDVDTFVRRVKLSAGRRMRDRSSEDRDPS
jgi:hypothetical protein